MSRTKALLALAGGFALLWVVLMFAAAAGADGYTSERTQAAWFGLVSWHMLGGAILSLVAAVATKPEPVDPYPQSPPAAD